MREYVDFSTLVGKTLVNIKVGDDEIFFTDTEGHEYKMYHQQDCCEYVYLEDVNGDWNDLIGNPILVADERDGDLPPVDGEGSYTWTFYTISTIKGTVDLRWYGSSNGYYSESVDFARIK